MKLIVNETGVDYEENALQVIARAAEGGMRDALSLLDQAISFGDEKVTARGCTHCNRSCFTSVFTQSCKGYKGS